MACMGWVGEKTANPTHTETRAIVSAAFRARSFNVETYNVLYRDRAGNWQHNSVVRAANSAVAMWLASHVLKHLPIGRIRVVAAAPSRVLDNKPAQKYLFGR